MVHLIDKDALVAELERRKKQNVLTNEGAFEEDIDILSFLNTLEVIDPYKQCIQYPSVKDGIEAHAETYSFNIESELFNQLTKEQQALWRKEIEYACISGGEMGVELARDPRYKENLKTKDALIERACKWLKENCKSYIIVDIDNKYEGLDGLFLEDFKKYMKGK